MRSRLWSAFKSNKPNETIKLLGCSFEKAKSHIESTFTEGMSWKNYGEWHIDHKIPLASAKDEEKLIELCHYKNLQALWAEDNWKKNDKM